MQHVEVGLTPVCRTGAVGIVEKASASLFRTFITVPVLVLLAVGASAQTVTPAQAGPQTRTAATVSGDIDPISVDLVVHDKSRKPYPDLKPEDLQVMDNGTAVTLKELRRVSADGSTEHVVTFVSDRFGGALGRNEQSIAAKILKELPLKGYSFAVFDLVPRLRLIQGFTGDRNAVKDAIRLVSEGPKNDKNPIIQLTASNAVYQKAIAEKDDPSSTAAKKAEKNLISIVRTGADVDGTRYDAAMRVRYKTLQDAMQTSRQVQQDRHTLPSLAALMALVRSQEKIAARKCIVYFTQNEQMDSGGKEMLRSIADAANQGA